MTTKLNKTTEQIREMHAKMPKTKTPADRYNDLCRMVDIPECPLFLKTHFTKAPLYCFDDFSQFLSFPFNGLLCDVPRTVILATDTRCVIVDVIKDPTVQHGVRLIRVEPGAERDVEQVSVRGDSLFVSLPNMANGSWEYVAKGRDFYSTIHPADEMSESDALVVNGNIQNTMVILAMLNHIDSPRHYVLSESPSRIRIGGPKAPRYDNRERYIVLDKDAVIKRYKMRKDHGATHASPAPHLRRGHFMTLSHDRYVNLKGQRIPVRPSWVGSREWTGGRGLKYKVVSRPGATESQA